MGGGAVLVPSSSYRWGRLWSFSEHRLSLVGMGWVLHVWPWASDAPSLGLPFPVSRRVWLK